jgi:winged helix DNA-binding protein
VGKRLRTISIRQRRHALVRRHHLGGDADGPEAVTNALFALHASDPATVYLSVLVRSAETTLADVSAAMYERRSLVRWMAMRRTLFVVAIDDVPIVQAAVSTPLAQALRRRLISQLERNGSDPPIAGGVARWLDELEARVGDALRTRGSATGAELSRDEPALRTSIAPRAPSGRPQNVTSQLLTLMSAEGRIVRGIPTGAWTSRAHRWEPVERWWPDGIPACDTADAQRLIANRWLARFGPATAEDLRWWMGWNKTTTRTALAGLDVEQVDLHGEPGIALRPTAEDPYDDDDAQPVAALLPALDPTPMGWAQREWFIAVPPHQIFDRTGNIGPTIWWDGEIVGSWAIAVGGEIRTAVLADRGAEARSAVETTAARLQDRLEGAVVTPAARTPLERSLSQTS